MVQLSEDRDEKITLLLHRFNQISLNKLCFFSPGAEAEPDKKYSISFTREELECKPNTELDTILTQTDGYEEHYSEKFESQLSFNQPSCNADYNYWFKQHSISLLYACLLVLGKDPRYIKINDIKKYATAKFSKKFLELYNTVRGYHQAGELPDPIRLIDFLTWMKQINEPIPIDLEIVLNDHGFEICDWRSISKELKIKSEEFKTLVTIKDEAIAQLKDQIKMLEALTIPQLDPTHPLYTKEFSMAVKLMKLILETYGCTRLKPRQVAEKYLEDNTDFTPDAKKRLCSVVNPDHFKTGGKIK